MIKLFTVCCAAVCMVTTVGAASHDQLIRMVDVTTHRDSKHAQKGKMLKNMLESKSKSSNTELLKNLSEYIKDDKQKNTIAERIVLFINSPRDFFYTGGFNTRPEAAIKGIEEYKKTNSENWETTVVSAFLFDLFDEEKFTQIKVKNAEVNPAIKKLLFEGVIGLRKYLEAIK